MTTLTQLDVSYPKPFINCSVHGNQFFFLSLLKLSSVYGTQFLRGRHRSKQDFPKKTIKEQKTKSEEAEANLDHGASLNNEVMYEELFLEFCFVHGFEITGLNVLKECTEYTVCT